MPGRINTPVIWVDPNLTGFYNLALNLMTVGACCVVDALKPLRTRQTQDFKYDETPVIKPTVKDLRASRKVTTVKKPIL